MSDLLKLAERCEKATGSDRELNAEIWMTLHPDWRDYPRNEMGGWVAEPFTASIDAAMTLAPEGMRVLSMFGPDVSLVTLHTEPFGAIGAWHNTVKAATPALALCAAALRARAAASPDLKASTQPTVSSET